MANQPCRKSSHITHAYKAEPDSLIALHVCPTDAHAVNLCSVALWICFCLHIAVRTFQPTWLSERCGNMYHGMLYNGMMLPVTEPSDF